MKQNFNGSFLENCPLELSSSELLSLLSSMKKWVQWIIRVFYGTGQSSVSKFWTKGLVA